MKHITKVNLKKAPKLVKKLSKHLDPLPLNQYDSRLLKYCSLIAQLVEQMTVNHWVPGSSPGQGAISTLLKSIAYKDV